jgi:hypothetical protein
MQKQYVVSCGWLADNHELTEYFDTHKAANEFANSIEIKWGIAVWTLVEETEVDEEAPDAQCGICHEPGCGGHLEGLPGNPYTVCDVVNCYEKTFDGPFCDMHTQQMMDDMEKDHAEWIERKSILDSAKEE